MSAWHLLEMHRLSYRVLPLFLSLVLLLLMGVIKPEGDRAFAADNETVVNKENEQPNMRISKVLSFGDMQLRVISDCSEGLCTPKHSIAWGNGETLELTSEQLSEPIERVSICDLDRDGDLELALTTTSCGSGRWGDFLLLEWSDGAWAPHRISEAPESVYSGCWGHQRITVWEDHVEVSFPVYTDDDANCCPSGGTRSLNYAFEENSFKLTGHKDGPSAQRMSWEG